MPVLVLIIASPGDLQNGLLALMTTDPQVKAILIAEDNSSALRLLELHRPTLVLLDMNLPENSALAILKQIASQWPTIRTVAIAGNVDQEQEAKAGSADRVLLKGFPASKLTSITEDLVS